jgi:hypothetical protein
MKPFRIVVYLFKILIGIIRWSFKIVFFPLKLLIKIFKDTEKKDYSHFAEKPRLSWGGSKLPDNTDKLLNHGWSKHEPILQSPKRKLFHNPSTDQWVGADYLDKTCKPEKVDHYHWYNWWWPFRRHKMEDVEPLYINGHGKLTKQGAPSSHIFPFKGKDKKHEK